MKENKEYITLYVADDGKSFRVKSECERYEREKEKDTCRKELFKYRILLPNPIVPDSHHPNADFIWFDVKNDDVYNLISLSYDKRYPNLEIKKSRYVCIEINHKGEIVNSFTIEESINYVNEYLRKLEKYKGV